ncbi:MAG: segregation/condensation protein A [Verrucomicrobiales bacterium]|nr:segregation/condensation protein A [Verrucomicrobiales bacterium]
MAEYKVQFEVFEGPLDLLLYLVRKEEVDIYQVNLTRLAEQFIEYIDLMREFDLDVASEFLVMASTLLYIKSRELLPVDKRVTDEQDDPDEEDPRWELIRKLVEYKKYKDAAARLQECEEEQSRVFLRRAPRLTFETPAPPLQVSVFTLLEAVNEILRRFKTRQDATTIEDDPWTVSGKMETIRGLLGRQTRVRFQELFTNASSRNEVVATFLALLELIRMKFIVATQQDAFGDIEIGAAPPAQDPVVAGDPKPTQAVERGGEPGTEAPLSPEVPAFEPPQQS